MAESTVGGAIGERGRRRRSTLAVAAGVVIVAVVLLVPERQPALPELPGGRPFAWRQDDLWRQLEGNFAAARAAGCGEAGPAITASLTRGRELVAELRAHPVPPGAPILGALERAMFEAGPAVAACPSHLADYLALQASLRDAVKECSRGWDMASQEARDHLYRLLYGSRAAVEEAMLQAPADATPALARGVDEPSSTPAVSFHGVTLHSGDLLVSRGGAPTSALIARGNDYPGNFSHVALLHVDQRGVAAVVEAHIERGVAVATAEEYLADTKLRIMVLRLRADLPALLADPLLPHRAAARVLERARGSHIPYDFAMDYRDHRRLFCSEVASAAYEGVGITLWTGLSRISSPGLAAWLAALGVRHLVTQEPSDLEYDPQLAVVAEWRDREVLFKDHVDNAVVDALLEEAERGLGLEYALASLPLARLAKAYSAALNLLGRVGPVPEGMSATTALRARRFGELHAAVAEDVTVAAAAFARERGYLPPYWELVRLAREGLARTAAPR